jgi:hypothetical protein
MAAFDPRLTPARPDLAASSLRGQVEAARYVDGEICEVVEALAPLRREPAPDAPLDTEALRGERVTVYESNEEGWAWGQLESDGYVGWLPSNALRLPGAEPTHRVIALRTLVFPGPSIKMPPLEPLPFGARVAVKRTEGPFAITTSGYLPARHLAPLSHRDADHVAVAERFVGAPYLWGGKTTLGIDCSGLVQIALTARGVPCPRDSDMQEAAVGAPARLSDLQRGDLVFWKGHVAIARDRASIVHANAFHMQVEIEPLAEAIERIREAGSEITSVRRIQ